MDREAYQAKIPARAEVWEIFQGNPGSVWEFVPAWG